MMLQSIAHAISENPEVYLLVLLIDERPPVTDMQRSVNGESFHQHLMNRHHACASHRYGHRKAKHDEHKRDVVILLDSITRLARAYNTVVPSSGKVLTEGVDANALQRPKRFFGAARNIEEGGSATIIATALGKQALVWMKLSLKSLKAQVTAKLCLIANYQISVYSLRLMLQNQAHVKKSCLSKKAPCQKCGYYVVS